MLEVVTQAPELGIETERERVEGLARKAIATHVLPALGAEGRDFELALPAYGKSSLVYLVDVDGGSSFVLRVEPSWRRYPAFRRRRNATLFWTRHELPTPRLLYQGLSPATRLKTGLFLLAEQKIEGINLVDQAQHRGGYSALGRTLARVHGVRRSWHYGALFRPELGSYAAHFQRRNQARLRQLEREGALTSEAQGKLARWFEQFDPARRPRKTLNLIHHRCSESDVMVDVEGKAWMLGPYGAGFGLFETDLVRAEVYICRDDPEKVGRLQQAYFGSFHPECFRLHERVAPAFRAEMHLAHACRGVTERTQELESLQRIANV